MGIYNCRTVAGSSTLSVHSCGRAYDIGIKPITPTQADVAKGMPIVNLLAEHGEELGISQLVYNRIIYDRSTPNGRPYKGVHPHYDHCHESQTINSGLKLTYATCVAVLGPVNAIPEEDEDMLGFDIGSQGEPAVVGERSKALQKMLNDRGADPALIVDGKAGDATRTALHDWKIEVGITATTSGGDGVIGAYEYAALFPPQAVSTGLTKAQADLLYPAKKAYDAHVLDVQSSTPHS
jgi:hypothetical protein